MHFMEISIFCFPFTGMRVFVGNKTILKNCLCRKVLSAVLGELPDVDCICIISHVGIHSQVHVHMNNELCIW